MAVGRTAAQATKVLPHEVDGTSQVGRKRFGPRWKKLGPDLCLWPQRERQQGNRRDDRDKDDPHPAAPAQTPLGFFVAHAPMMTNPMRASLS